MDLIHKVDLSEDETTIAHLLRDKMNISARLLNKLKMNEKIFVNDVPVFSNFIIHTNDLVKVNLDFEEQDYISAEKMDLKILYEDDYFLAIDKPAGIVVHPSSNHLSGTLANGVKYYLNNKKKIRAINRLDKDTSGIVLFAKNEYIQELMAKNINIEKEYLAITNGILPEKKGIIDLPIARKEGSIMERCVSVEGQKAVTLFEVLEKIENKFCLVKLKLKTGRTHQIRVHLAYMGTPILGDTLYGTTSDLISRQALHAIKMSFIHPIMNKYIEIIAEIPEDMKQIIN